MCRCRRKKETDGGKRAGDDGAGTELEKSRTKGSLSLSLSYTTCRMKREGETKKISGSSSRSKSDASIVFLLSLIRRPLLFKTPLAVRFVRFVLSFFFSSFFLPCLFLGGWVGGGRTFLEMRIQYFIVYTQICSSSRIVVSINTSS